MGDDPDIWKAIATNGADVGANGLENGTRDEILVKCGEDGTKIGKNDEKGDRSWETIADHLIKKAQRQVTSRRVFLQLNTNADKWLHESMGIRLGRFEFVLGSVKNSAWYTD